MATATMGVSSVDRLARSKRPIVERTEIHIPPAPQLSPEAITGPTPNRLAAVSRFNADLQKWRNDAWAVEMPGQPDFALQTDVATLRDDTKEMIANIQTNTINIANIQTDITTLQTDVTNIDSSITNITNATATGSGIVQANGTGNPQTAVLGTPGYFPYWSASDPFLTATGPIYTDGTFVGVGTITPDVVLHAQVSDFSSTSVEDVLKLEHHAMGGALGIGAGTGILLTAHSDTVADREQGRIQTRWTTAADATRASAMDLQTAATGGTLTTQVTIDALGKVGIGIGSGVPTIDGKLHVAETSTANLRGLVVDQYSNDASAGRVVVRKSRSSTVGGHTILNSGDVIFNFNARGSDGVQFLESSYIRWVIDGTPGLNDMPGRIEFATTLDGTTSSVERMRINNAGNIGLNATTWGTNAIRVLAIGGFSVVAPTTSLADIVQFWVKDRGGVGGKAAFHILTEDGTSHVIGDFVGFGTITPTVRVQATIDDAITVAVTDVLKLNHSSTGTPGAAFGTGLLFAGESSTTDLQDMARMQASWTTATHATRTSAIEWQTVNTALALATRMALSGAGGLSVGDATNTIAVGVINAVTGYRVNNAVAAVGSVLGGNGTNFVPTALAASSFPHVVLDSTVHTDTLTGTVLQGDIIYGNATPKWARLAKGATSTVLRANATDVLWGQVVLTTDVTGVLPLLNGGTNAALVAVNGGAVYSTATAFGITAVGVSGQVLTSQAAAPPIWTTIAAVTPAALTKVDDTNITLALGGSPTVALLAATSITLGWTGVLSIARGGTNQTAFGTNSVIFFDGTRLADDGAAFTYAASGDNQLLIAKALGNVPSDNVGYYALNSSVAATGAANQQWSPEFLWEGQGWGGSSQIVKYRAYVATVEAATNPTAYWILERNINALGYIELMRADSTGFVRITKDAIGAVDTTLLMSTYGLQLQNDTASTAPITRQDPPGLTFKGSAWNSTGVVSQDWRFRIHQKGVTVAGTTRSYIRIDSGMNASAFANPIIITSHGGLAVGALWDDTPNGIVNAQAGFRIANTAASGTYLGGNGTNFVAVTLTAASFSHVMLNSTVHTDTLTAAVSRGAIIVANSTPAWARLQPLGTGRLLFTDGTDTNWSDANLQWVQASNSLRIGSPTPLNSTIAALTASARTTSSICYYLTAADTSVTATILKVGLYVPATGAWSSGAGSSVTAISGLANGSPVENIGGMFESEGAATDSYGVYGRGDAAGTNNYGVYGISTNVGATNNYGGYFTASNGLTSNFALFCNGGKIKNNSVDSIICANAALATNATFGFLYVPTCAGLPTGVPVAETGTCALQFNTTSNKIALYDTKWFQFSPYEVKSYDVADTGNVGIGEDTLRTYTVPGNTLSDNGDSIEFYAAGTFATSINSKRLRVKFGATTIFDSGALAITTTADWSLEGSIIRVGATTQRAIVRLTTSSGTLASYCDYATAAETLSGNVDIVITGEATANDDVVCTLFKLMTLGCA